LPTTSSVMAVLKQRRRLASTRPEATRLLAHLCAPADSAAKSIASI
jgi:hypothetical protein